MHKYNDIIGKRIKELRELSDISTEELSSELNMDEETYIKYEKGEEDIPASLIYEIAGVFNVDMGLLLNGEESRMSIFDVTRSGEGVKVNRRSEYTYENLCKKFIHKKAEMFIVTVNPKENPTPSFNKHPGQEFNYILQGSMKLFIHNNEITLNEGDCVFFDSTHKHAMIALNNETAKFLAVLM